MMHSLRQVQPLTTHLSQIGLGDFLHLGENHRGDLFSVEGLCLAFVVHLHFGPTPIVDDLERPVFHVGVDHGVIKAAANEALGIWEEETWEGVRGGDSTRTIKS